MGIAFSLAENVLREGLVYALMAIGVYITYKILDFPDLSVDGTFPLGGCLAAVLINAGADPWLTLLAAFAAGALAGSATGLLHVKLKITNLLSGILVMTALWSVNLILTGGKAVVQFFNRPTIFTTGLGALLTGALYSRRKLIIALILAVALKLIIDRFLTTRMGLLLRACGNNPQFVVNLGKDPGTVKILGLMIGNGCAALAGCVLAQISENADINAGKGMVVMALAAVIIGTSLFERFGRFKGTTMAIFGAILYKAALQAALSLGLPPNYLKLLMAALLTLALISKEFGAKERYVTGKEVTNENAG